jgi:GAF domain-containing protein
MGEAKSAEAKLDALCRLGQALVLLRDEQQVGSTVLKIAEEVLDFQDSEFLIMDDARGELFVVAQRGELNLATDRRLSLDGREGITVAAARSGRAVYVPDVSVDPRYVDAGFPAASELAVPVQIEDRLLGVINVENRKRDAYTPADTLLLSTLASQAALALENARLYARERRRAEEMVAVNQIARRVGATLDLRETLDRIVAAAGKLVPCTLAEISLWDPEQQMLTLQALQCVPERRFPIGESYPPGTGYTGWVVRNREPLLVPDVSTLQDIRPDILPGEHPFEAYVGVPLLSGDELIGTLVLIDDRAGAFDEQDLRVLETLAGQASVAIRNARLYEELARRHRELAALYAVAQGLNRPLDLEGILQEALDRVLAVTQAQGGGIRLIDPDRQELVLVAHRGLSEVYVRQARRLPLSQEITGWVSRMGEPALSDDMWEDPRVSPEIRELLKEVGHRSMAQVPLPAQEGIVGTLGLVSQTAGFFTADDLKLIDTIGRQLGVAIDNARLRRHILEQERLAAVGRVASTVAHELRSPLGGIARSAEFLARPELSNETRHRLSQAIVSLARRLINTTQEILDYVRGKPLSLQPAPCSLPEFLDRVLPVMEVDFADRGIEVVRDCRYTGTVVMDEDRIAQVIYNIAANARDAMPRGGTFAVTTRQVDGRVELVFADTGPGVPEELRDRIFEPFFTRGKREGAGLGLAIARRIVEEHGGELRLEGSAARGATFVVSLPV